MTSPFKFLDAYDPNDKDIFFGRSAEIDELYALIYQTDLLLVYGQSGTGKTSLIQCGLASRFKPTDRFELLVRRKDNLNASLDYEIRRQALTPIAEDATLDEAVQSLYLDHLRPVHFIFDQFEELFLLGSVDEQRTFIASVASLLKRGIACKVIIVMREEFIAMLYEFEKAVPRLFAKRFRVEPMTAENVVRVIVGTTRAFGIGLEHGDDTARQIIANLSDPRSGVQLSFLQVYLDKLYRKASQERERAGQLDQPLVFSERLVRETGALEDVLADFLAEQIAAVQRLLEAAGPVPADAVQVVLEQFATLDGTKQPITRAELLERVPELRAVIDPCLQALETHRVLRRVDAVYELAHDALARRIADSRSAERKTLLKVQRLIKDRCAGYEQTKTLLSREELGFVTPFLPKLTLTADEAAFLTRSRATLRSRQRRWIAATAAFVVFLLAVLAFVGAAQLRADAAINDAQAVIGFLSRMEAALDTIPGAEDIKRELHDGAASLSRRLQQSASGDTNEASTQFWEKLKEGDMAYRSGDTDTALTAYRLAFDTAQAPGRSGNAVWDRNRALASMSIGDVYAGLYEKGDPAAQPRAIDSYQAALRIFQRRTAEASDDLQAQRDTLLVHVAVGDVWRRFGDRDLARKHYQQALTTAEQLAGVKPGHEEPSDLAKARDLFEVYKRIADLDRGVSADPDSPVAAGSLDDALEEYDKALRVAQLLADSGNDPLAVNDVSVLYTEIGNILLEMNNPSGARGYFQKALEHDESVARQPMDNLRISYVSLGDLELDLNPAAARAWYAKGGALAEQLAAFGGSPTAHARASLAWTYYQMGQVERRGANRAAARAWFEKALTITEALVREEDSATRDPLPDVRGALQEMAGETRR